MLSSSRRISVSVFVFSHRNENVLFNVSAWSPEDECTNGNAVPYPAALRSRSVGVLTISSLDGCSAILDGSGMG